MKYSLEPTVNENPKRSWCQFRLRTLLLAVTVLCVGPGGYVAYEQRKAREQKAAVLAIERLGALVIYDDMASVRSPMMRQILGDESFGNVRHIRFGAQATDANLVHLAPLTKLEILDLDRAQVTDAGFVHLVGLKKLEELQLDKTRVTEAAVAELRKALPNCRIILLYP